MTDLALYFHYISVYIFFTIQGPIPVLNRPEKSIIASARCIYVAMSCTLFYKHGVFFSQPQYMLRKKLFSASKYTKDMLAYRKGTPCCFMQQTIAFHEYGSKCCSMETFNELICQKHIKRFEACCIFLQ